LDASGGAQLFHVEYYACQSLCLKA
jgi:hypothetical protein